MSTRLMYQCTLNADELDHCLELTHLVFRGLIEGADRLLAQHGLGRAHQRILWIVARQPSLPTGIVAEFLGVSLQALHKSMRELIDRGLVLSTPDPQNRRLRRIALTTAGSRLEAKLTGPQRAAFAAVVSRLGPEAIGHWRAVMDELVTDFGTKRPQVEKK